MPKRRRRRVRLSFFEELEALDSAFFHDIDEILRLEQSVKEYEAAERQRRAINAEKARRIYPRLKFVENFNCYNYTSHIEPDFFGSNRDRVKATKLLHEKRERIRWFLRALYNYWMFDEPIPHATPYMGLRYSRHRKWFEKYLRGHKRKARKVKRVSKKAIRAERKARATEALEKIKQSSVIARLRTEGETHE